MQCLNVFTGFAQNETVSVAVAVVVVLVVVDVAAFVAVVV